VARAYIFDAMVVASGSDAPPEKWERPFAEVRGGRAELLLFEPLVAEMVFQLSKRFGPERAKSEVRSWKSLPGTRLCELDDSWAFAAAAARLKHQNEDISYVDAFILDLARRERAKVLTTDCGLRDAARREKVDVSFLPWCELRPRS
jgi:predicted nucleic acid-binding protein